jgi:hypothetical protein
MYGAAAYNGMFKISAGLLKLAKFGHFLPFRPVNRSITGAVAERPKPNEQGVFGFGMIFMF